MQKELNQYLLETMAQINKLTNIFMSVDLSADNLAQLIDLKNKAIFDLLKVVDEFTKIAGVNDAKQ